MANQFTVLPMPDRFWERVIKTIPPWGCWLWRGTHDHAWYARFGKGVAHRTAYRLEFGPVPDGLELDHLCGNRGCVNPDHLEAVTRAENIRRSQNFAARNARKTHCPKGHPYSGPNLLVRPSGDRRCRACIKAANDARPFPKGHNARLAGVEK